MRTTTRRRLVAAAACTLVLAALCAGTSSGVAGAQEGRTTGGTVLLYDFREGGGAVVHDSGGTGRPVDLTIADPSQVRWSGEGLEVLGPARITSTGPAAPAIEAYTSNDDVTVELWITPADPDPAMPGRLFSIGLTSSIRSLVISQGYWKGGENDQWEARARTSASYSNPLSADVVPSEAPTHLVFRRQGRVMELWVDGKLAGRIFAEGSSLAAADGLLSIASDPDGSAPWKGTYHLLAVHDHALTDEELARNHAAGPQPSPPGEAGPPTWTRLSAGWGDLPLPTGYGLVREKQQTASLTGDFDGDGDTDFVIAGRRQPGPSLTLYRRGADGWTTSAIEPGVLNIEAGGATHDIDGDGDLDLALGGDSQSNEIWWWQNPGAAAVLGPWPRFTIKSTASAGRQQHDMVFAQLDRDAPLEVAYWVQKPRPDGDRLFVADIPASPTTVADWPAKEIYRGATASEGLAAADVDGDGDIDLAGGGRWFEQAAGTFTDHPVDPAASFSRTAVGQLVPGGWSEIVLDSGDALGALAWYGWDGSGWVRHELDASSRNGHSLDLGDVDGDGRLDILAGEMAIGGDGPRLRLLYGDGSGNFEEQLVATGVDNHESRLVDLDGDGDLDILGKPYTAAPGVDVWLNAEAAATTWHRHPIDDARPWRAVFVEPVDVDGDGDTDVVAGGWWYENSGSLAGPWTRHDIGFPLHNMVAVHDVDGDGDVDVIGTRGKDNGNAEMVWARNDGAGSFTTLTNIAPAIGKIPQGVVVARLEPKGPLRVVLSFNEGTGGTQALTVPADPSNQPWTHTVLSPFSTGEEVIVDDVDGDGDQDLFMGTDWLRNDRSTWTRFPVYTPVAGFADRVRLLDVDGDGDDDAVVGHGHDPDGLLAWYERGADPKAPWAPHPIANLVLPQSLDAADLDGDGDLDLAVGEHRLDDPSAGRTFVFWHEGKSFRPELVATGDEHHDGTQFADLDGDGDLDIVSLGWSTGRTFVLENPSS